MGREALESSSAAFQATAKPSQLPTRGCPPASLADLSPRKKARCPCDTEPLGGFQTVLRPRVTSAGDGRGYSRRAVSIAVRTRYLVARNIPSLCVLGSNSVVKTTWKSRFLQDPKDRHELPGALAAGLHPFRRRPQAKVHADFLRVVPAKD